MSQLQEFPIPKIKEEKPKQQSQFHLTTHTVNGKKIPLVQAHSMHGTFQRILNHNDNSGGYSQCLIVGSSGSGKTTIVKSFESWLCKNNRNFKFLWLSGKDVPQLDHILESLPKGIDHVLVLDDSSFSTSDIEKGRLEQMASKFTTVRHITKARIITIFIIHYGTAIMRFLRSCPFSIYTSINSTEIHSIHQLYPNNPTAINQFAKHYRNSTLYGFFEHILGSWEQQKLKYQTRICRPVLINEANWLHSAISFPESCSCGRHEQKAQFQGDVKQITDKILETVPKSTLNQTLNYFLMVKKGKMNFLPANYKSCWKKLCKIENTCNLDFLEMREYLDTKYENKTHTKLKTKHKKEENDLINELAKNIN